MAVALFGRQQDSMFTPSHSTAFVRVITDHQYYNSLRFIFSLIHALVFHLRQFREAGQLIAKTKSAKVNWKRRVAMTKILAFAPDVIHVQWPSHLEQFTRLLSKPAPKFLVSLRGRQVNVTPAVDPVVANFYQETFPSISGFHAVSKAIAKVASQYGATEDKTTVIYSPVAERFFNAFDLQKKAPGTTLRIVSVGRFHWMKGYSYALDAMKILGEKGIDFQYTIIAPGNIPDEILYQINDLNLVSRVNIVKGVPHDKMAEELKAHSVFLLPSVKEGIANAAIESMASGVPVIATNCGGMHEVIEHGETGLLVPPYSARALAEALIHFSAMNEQAVGDMRIKAAAAARKNFYYPDQMLKFIALYETLAKP